MPRLILLNGPPGSGKSTIARRYVDAQPMALLLDVDVLRASLGSWRTDPTRAGLAARELAVAMARVHLLSGHDVVVPQYVGRPEFLEQLESSADEVAAEFHEIVLLDDKESAIRRFEERDPSGDPVHRDAAELVDRGGGRAHLEEMYDRLVALLSTRQRAVVVTPVVGDVEATVRAVMTALRLHHG